MKRKSIISVLLLGMMSGLFFVSCQDMLSPSSERHSYTVATDTLYSYWGIVRSLQNIADRYIILNECRGDLVDATTYVSDSIGAIADFGECKDPATWWRDGACAYLKIADYYHIINSCNAYIAMCDTVRTTGTNQPYMLKELAQVHAIRAWVYMQLLYAYGENRVPLYTKPMLSTDAIDAFLSAKSPALVTRESLARELGPKLKEMELIEKTYGLPEYNNYGDVSMSNSHFVCHSSKCMFPVSIVLGDLYLLSGDYAESAQHYYNFLNSEKGGPLLTSDYFCTGLLSDRQDHPIYARDGIPYMEPEATSRNGELITCIPSNHGKLEGKVLTDVSRLFGFEAELFTSANEDANAGVYLTRMYEHELAPSQGYEDLCDSQPYEIYVGTVAGGNFTAESIEVLENEKMRVGDARRQWIYGTAGDQWLFRVGDDIKYGKLIHKQNPNGLFTTTYPVIYRKSTVWLRFAEALNRAGYPGHAFAILKTGLCNSESDEWFPRDPAAMYQSWMKAGGNPYKLSSLTDDTYPFDYPLKSDGALYCYAVDENTFLPEGWLTDDQMHSPEELEAWLKAKMETGSPDVKALVLAEEGDGGESGDEEWVMDQTKIYWGPAGEDAFENVPAVKSPCACYYIGRSELLRASTAPYLNFKDQVNLRGSGFQLISYKEQGTLELPYQTLESFSGSNTNMRYTIGVHQRGCGFIYYNEGERMRENPKLQSRFNYVDKVKEKIKEATGSEVDETYIYDDANLDIVEDAVEELIIDEMALELAFEGTRFSDLCRVAMRRGNDSKANDFLAKRVAKRHMGQEDASLRTRLQNRNNWFLPIPQD